MSEPSHSNDHIDEPRRGIGRFLWLNAGFTTLGTIAVGLSFDNVYVLYPLSFGFLIGGVAIIFREMFKLLGEDSQYAPDEVAADLAEEATAEQPRTITPAPRVGAPLHTA